MGCDSSPNPARSKDSASSRNSDSGAVPVQMENDENQVKQIKGIHLFDGRKAKFPAWKHNFLYLGKLYGLFGILTDGVDVPVADETMSIAGKQDAIPRENVQNHFIAWNILSWAFADNGDRDTLRHVSSLLAAGWCPLVDTYSASTIDVNVQCLQSLPSRRVKPGANPIPVFTALIEDVRNMRPNGSDIENEVVCLLFL